MTGAKPLSESMLEYCELDHGKQNSMHFFYQNITIFFQENAFENVVWKTAAILSVASKYFVW